MYSTKFSMRKLISFPGKVHTVSNPNQEILVSIASNHLGSFIVGVSS
jgi:hypothetical protein